MRARRAEEGREGDAPDDVGGLDKVPEEIAADGDSSDTVALDGDGRVLDAEEIRLQAGLHDVERARDDRAAHTAQPEGPHGQTRRARRSEGCSPASNKMVPRLGWEPA